MREIQGKARTVRELLRGVKYSIDYYQREFKWGQKQVAELVDDLSGKFLEDYCDGYIYHKPFREYEGVTPIKGWFKWRNSRKAFSDICRVKQFPWWIRCLPKKWFLSLGVAEDADIPRRFRHLR